MSNATLFKRHLLLEAYMQAAYTYLADSGDKDLWQL